MNLRLELMEYNRLNDVWSFEANDGHWLLFDSTMNESCFESM